MGNLPTYQGGLLFRKLVLQRASFFLPHRINHFLCPETNHLGLDSCYVLSKKLEPKLRISVGLAPHLGVYIILNKQPSGISSRKPSGALAQIYLVEFQHLPWIGALYSHTLRCWFCDGVVGLGYVSWAVFLHLRFLVYLRKTFIFLTYR